MRLAALIIGLFGGVLGFIAAVIAASAGGLATAFGAHGGHTVLWLSVSAFLAAVLGVIGAALAMSKPKAAWILLIIAAVWSVISTSAFGAPAGFLMFVAAVLAFIASRATAAPSAAAGQTSQRS
jgi:hypothetical protein